jgi:hypothetical protein
MARKQWTTAEKVGGVALVAVGTFFWIYASFVIADLLTFWWVYSTSRNVLENLGATEFSASVLGVLFASATTLLATQTLWYMLKRDRRWVPTVAVGLCVWFYVMHAFASPYDETIFNPFSGEARAKYYRTADGTILKMPKGAQVGPEGQPLQIFDPRTAEAFEKQKAQREKAEKEQLEKKKAEEEQAEKDASIWKSLAGVFGNSDRAELASPSGRDNLTLWIEKIQLAPDRTILHMACKGNYGSSGVLRPAHPIEFGWSDGKTYTFEPPETTYLTDGTGRTYDLIREDATYSPHENDSWLYGKGIIIDRIVRADEIYHFTFTFSPLSPRASGVRLHHPWFNGVLEMDRELKRAEATEVATKPAGTAQF